MSLFAGSTRLSAVTVSRIVTSHPLLNTISQVDRQGDAVERQRKLSTSRIEVTLRTWKGQRLRWHMQGADLIRVVANTDDLRASQSD